jgi:CLIP-associating protein 1/2
VLEQISDGTNRPGGPMPSLLLEAIKLFQKNDPESKKTALKKIRDASKEIELDDWERQWPRIQPILLEIAANSFDTSDDRLMALHCLRDASEVKSNLMIDSAEGIIEKYLAIMSQDERDLTRASQTAAMALLGKISIWNSVSILASHVSDPLPIGRDAIDMCRMLFDGNNSDLGPISSQQAQNAIHQLLPRLLKQWTSEHAGLRKAVVYCLVVIYLKRQDIVRPYLDQTTNANRKLFDLYLKKHNASP